MDFNPRLRGFPSARPSGSTHTAMDFFVPDLRVQPTLHTLPLKAPASRLRRGVRPTSASRLGIRLSSFVSLGAGQHTRSPPANVRGEVVGKE
jgi:hypothetical protein